MTELNCENIALDVLMERISNHLDALASKVFEIEESVGGAVSETSLSGHKSEAITRLQSLDFLRQSLEDLALLSISMSKHAGSLETNGIPIEVFLETIKLDSTKNLIGSAVHCQDASFKNGDLDLF